MDGPLLLLSVSRYLVVLNASLRNIFDDVVGNRRPKKEKGKTNEKDTFSKRAYKRPSTITLNMALIIAMYLINVYRRDEVRERDLTFWLVYNLYIYIVCEQEKLAISFGKMICKASRYFSSNQAALKGVKPGLTGWCGLRFLQFFSLEERRQYYVRLNCTNLGVEGIKLAPMVDGWVRT